MIRLSIFCAMPVKPGIDGVFEVGGPGEWVTPSSIGRAGAAGGARRWAGQVTRPSGPDPPGPDGRDG